MRLRKVIDNHLVIERLTRSDFSKEMGWSPSQVSRWLNGGKHGNLSGQHLSELLRWLLEDEE